MRIHIELDQCEGHGRCAAVDAELFPLDDDGYVARSDFSVPAGAEDSAARGVAQCPMAAIRLLQD